VSPLPPLSVYDADAVDEVLVQLAVRVDELRRGDADEPAEGFVDRVGGDGRVEARERGAEVGLKVRLIEGRALGDGSGAIVGPGRVA